MGRFKETQDRECYVLCRSECLCVCVCVWTLGDGLKIEKEEIKKIEYLGITFYKVYNDINHV